MIITEKNNPLIPCVRCGKGRHPTQLYYFNGEGGYCVDCFIGAGLGNAIIGHNYKPMPVFCHLSTEKEDTKKRTYRGKVIKKGHKLLYLGIELEIEHRSKDLVKYAYEMQREYPIYIKYDGSLQGGFEMVSHPLTSKYHQKIFNWYKLLEGLRKDNFTSYDNGRCGLHIHVNKNFFDSRDDILKVVLFFYKCFDKIKRFSKRRKMDYCRKWEESLVNLVESYKGNVEIKENNYDRYTCVNLQNRNTVEFRIYRGTLNHDRFLASILFTDAICYFTKNYSIAFIANKKHTGVILWKKFIKFVQENDRYEFLKKYFKRNNLDDDKLSKTAPPACEDYTGKGYKVEITVVNNIKASCIGSGIEKYIIEGLSYEFVKDELSQMNLKDAFAYYMVSAVGKPSFLTPKRISRVLLKKKSVKSIKIARMIKLYLDTSEYTLRIRDSGGALYKEAQGMFDLMVTVNLAKPDVKSMREFIETTDFKYELMRRDVVSVYNNMQTSG